MININLIAERRMRRLREMTIIRVGSLSVICLLLLMVMLNVAAWMLSLSAKSELRSAQVKLDKQQPRYQEWLDVQQQITARKPVVSLLEQVQKSESAWMNVLSDMSVITPPEVVLDVMTTMTSGEKNVKLHFSGRARDERTVGSFMLAMSRETRWAGEPVLISCTGEAAEGEGSSNQQRPFVKFELEVPIRGMVGGDF